MFIWFIDTAHDVGSKDTSAKGISMYTYIPNWASKFFKSKEVNYYLKYINIKLDCIIVGLKSTENDLQQILPRM